MSVQEAGSEVLGTLAKTQPVTLLLVIVIGFLIWKQGEQTSELSQLHAEEVGELSNQLKAQNFVLGIKDCETQECRDRFITTFTDWINLRKSGCE